MGILNRELIKAAKRRVVEVECPELDGTILICEVSAGQLKELDNTDIAQQLSMMIVDETGNLIFNDPEGIALLNDLSATVSMRLITAAAKLNGISQAAVDETIKNLLASQSDGSVSA